MDFMGQGAKTSRFPLGATLAAMTLATLLLAWPADVLARLVAEQPFSAPGVVVFAGTCVWASGVLGLLPVLWVSRRGVMPTAFACFIGMGLRLVGCLAAAMVAVHGYDLPGRPTAAALAVFYLPLLLIEVGFLGRYLWHKSESPAGKGSTALSSERQSSTSDLPSAKVLST